MEKIEAKRRKKGSKKLGAKRSRIIDNPLLQSTLKPREGVVAPTVSKEYKPAVGGEEKLEQILSSDEERTSIFEIVSDLEKQLDAAFSIKDTQEQEIAKLKEQFEEAEEKAISLNAKVKDMRKSLVSQEELSSELEFLENERLEAGEKIAVLEKENKKKTASIGELEEKTETLTKEVEVRDTRIEQIELELNSTNVTIQSFQSQISLLEDEKEEMSKRLGSAETETGRAITERDRCQKELQRAKESLDEIRLMLADTRARAKEHYYKGTRKGSKKS